MITPPSQFTTHNSQFTIFDESFLRRLERLALITRRVRAGRGQGERRSTKRGSSVEFADYRDYTPGDDLRRLDWRVYARLERPFIKLFEEEEDQSVHILLDSSGSMDWPEGEAELNKWDYGRRLVAALAYIGLVNGDQVTITTLGEAAENGGRSWGPHRGRRHVHTLLQFLEEQTASGPTNFNQALRQFSRIRRRTGLLFLISDCFAPEGYEQGLSALGNVGYETNLLHTLAPDEIDPGLSGDLKLEDIETGHIQEFTIDATIRRLYQERFETWRGDLERYCFSRAMNYVTLDTSVAFDAVILGVLRQRGFVR